MSDQRYEELRDAVRNYLALDGCGNANEEQQQRRNVIAKLVGSSYASVTVTDPGGR